MKHKLLSKETSDVNIYISPACEVLSVDTQKVICDSDTEHVDEEEGEW